MSRVKLAKTECASVVQHVLVKEDLLEAIVTQIKVFANVQTQKMLVKKVYFVTLLIRNAENVLEEARAVRRITNVTPWKGIVTRMKSAKMD